MCNEFFVKSVKVLKAMPACGEFSKKHFEQMARPLFVGCTSPSTIFEHLREMGLVVLAHKEDLSIVVDRWGDEQDITFEQYQDLPACVQDALDWDIRPRCRNWYRVDYLALAQMVADRKSQLMAELAVLNSL